MKKSVKKSKKRSKPKSKYLKTVSVKLQKMISLDVDRYLNVLGMNHYKTKVLYMKNDIEMDEHTGGSVAATATVDLRYLTVSVRIFPFMVNCWMKKSMSDEDIHEIVAHEISHIATNHMYRMATATYKDEGEMKDAWESLTTIVGRLVHEVDKRRRGFKKLNEK